MLKLRNRMLKQTRFRGTRLRGHKELPTSLEVYSEVDDTGAPSEMWDHNSVVILQGQLTHSLTAEPSTFERQRASPKIFGLTHPQQLGSQDIVMP